MYLPNINIKLFLSTEEVFWLKNHSETFQNIFSIGVSKFFFTSVFLSEFLIFSAGFRFLGQGTDFYIQILWDKVWILDLRLAKKLIMGKPLAGKIQLRMSGTLIEIHWSKKDFLTFIGAKIFAPSRASTYFRWALYMINSAFSPLTRAQVVVHANLWLIFDPSTVVQKLGMYCHPCLTCDCHGIARIAWRFDQPHICMCYSLSPCYRGDFLISLQICHDKFLFACNVFIANTAALNSVLYLSHLKCSNVLMLAWE